MSEVSVMVRLAGLPISVWLAGASPELFDELRQLDDCTRACCEEGHRLAEVIGVALVPHPALSPAQRSTALAVRRSLYSFGPVGEADLAAVCEQAASLLNDPTLATQLVSYAALSEEIRRGEHAAATQVDEELAALRARAWQLITSHPVAYLAVLESDVDTLQDIERRVAAGEPWSTKRMRQRADYLWRLINRGAAKVMPRGWLGQIAVVEVREDGTLHLQLSPEVGRASSENLHERARLAAAFADRATGWSETMLGVTPLHWYRDSHDDAGRFEFWVRRAEDPSKLHIVRLRATPLLVAVVHALQAGELSVEQLLRRLLPSPESWSVGRPNVVGFLQYLADSGVLECSAPGPGRPSTWQPLAVAELSSASGSEFVDVYRRPNGAALPAEPLRRLAGELEPVSRLLTVIGGNRSLAPGLRWIGAEPRPLLDVVAAQLGDAANLDQPPHNHDWPAMPGEPSAYSRLRVWLEPRLDSRDPVDLEASPAVRDADRAGEVWPTDYLVRPFQLDGRLCVALDHIEPAAVVDSRFSDSLLDLGCDAGRQNWYREFLTELEVQGGGRCVELMVPALHAKAANAVRRPGYTRAWTGYSNVSHYTRRSEAPTHYIPLAKITLRHEQGTIIAEAGGDQLWPMMHATRSLPEPWPLIARWLLYASPQPLRGSWRTLGWSLPGWPERNYLPRLTLSGGRVVITPAQWRIPVSELWQPADTASAKARGLARLRARLSLPRWVRMCGDVHQEPLACDVDSLQTLQLVDRLVRSGATELLVAEMIPSPDQFMLDDPLHAAGPSGSEWLVRLPWQASPGASAQRALQAMHRDRPTALAGRP
ncbi:MAG: lantibiotic dehydratase [Chloroflexota bacterium]